MKAKLNSKLINDWLIENNRSAAWLARQIEIEAPAMYYRLESGSLIDIGKIAAVLGVSDPKDLIEMVE